MKATVLVDNIPQGGLYAQWGLSIYIEYNNKNILLDFGATDLMFQNADSLGKDIKAVDMAVLSHCHYDHSGGMERFLKENQKAPLFVRSLQETCHAKKPFKKKRYNGIPKGVLGAFSERVFAKKGKTQIDQGVYLLDHKRPMALKGLQSNLFTKKGPFLLADDFSHEQSLIFETEKGLVIFNSCCHSGANIVIKEAMEAFPNQKIRALIGGFHLFEKRDRQVKKLAKKIEATGIDLICTGHCTGEKAYGILKEYLGEKCTHFYTGLVLEF